MSLTAIPYYHASVDWKWLMEQHPPPPMYAEKIGRLDEGAVREMQDRLFMQRVDEAWRIPFFSERWRSAGIEPGDIRSLDDLGKLPIYNSDDLKAAIEARPPFGSHQPMGREDFGTVPIKIQTSGGTTGLPRVSLFDPVAWEVQAIQGARGMWMQGVRPGDVAQVPSTCALGNAPWLQYKACHDWLGVVPVTTGSGVVTPTERQLELALAYGVNVWIGNAEYLGRLPEVAEQIDFDLTRLATKLLHSNLGNDPSRTRRKNLEAAFGAPAYDSYGTHEVGEIAAECVHKSGMHVFEDTVHLEVVDVDTLEPRGFDQLGSVVATSLHRSCPPILRYDLRDLMELYPREVCDCGLSTTRLSHFQGRADEMVKVRGQNVYPRAVDAVLHGDERCNGQYLCVATARPGMVVDATEMTVRIERRSTDVDKDDLHDDMAALMKRTLNVRVGVEIVDPGELGPLTGYGVRDGKVKRLLDLR